MVFFLLPVARYDRRLPMFYDQAPITSPRCSCLREKSKPYNGEFKDGHEQLFSGELCLRVSCLDLFDVKVVMSYYRSDDPLIVVPFVGPLASNSGYRSKIPGARVNLSRGTEHFTKWTDQTIFDHPPILANGGKSFQPQVLLPQLGITSKDFNESQQAERELAQENVAREAGYAIYRKEQSSKPIKHEDPSTPSYYAYEGDLEPPKHVCITPAQPKSTSTLEKQAPQPLRVQRTIGEGYKYPPGKKPAVREAIASQPTAQAPPAKAQSKGTVAIF